MSNSLPMIRVTIESPLFKTSAEAGNVFNAAATAIHGYCAMSGDCAPRIAIGICENFGEQMTAEDVREFTSGLRKLADYLDERA
jgi:hypothetical protein